MKTTFQNNKRISVLGMGQMGRKIAQLYVEADYQVTVWNRTPGKVDGLDNIHTAETVEEAILASPLIILIISNNKSVLEILADLPDIRVLKNKTLINFTTGSPEEAESIEKIISDVHGAYIHGAIQASPDQLGLKSATILSSGNKEAFEKYVKDLAIIGGNIRQLSEQAAASSAMDTATSTWIYGSFLGLIYGAELSRHYGLSLKDYGTIIGEIAPEFIDYFKYEVDLIESGDFRATQSTLSNHLTATQRLADSFKAINVEQVFPTLINDLLKKAEQKGFGDEELAALSKIIVKQS